jgi:hypothetical protein
LAREQAEAYGQVVLLLLNCLADNVDVQVGDWEDKGGVKERSLTYVMHMVSRASSSTSGLVADVQNNYIGPKKSDCIGSERVELANPSKAYEIVSETQTPDVPSGKR